MPAKGFIWIPIGYGANTMETARNPLETSCRQLLSFLNHSGTIWLPVVVAFKPMVFDPHPIEDRMKAIGGEALSMGGVSKPIDNRIESIEFNVISIVFIREPLGIRMKPLVIRMKPLGIEWSSIGLQ